MYFSVGGDMAVRDQTVIGIFDLDNASWSYKTREFLRRQEQDGAVIPVGDELPKSFVLTHEMGMDRVYLTQFSTATLEKRFTSEQDPQNNEG